MAYNGYDNGYGFPQEQMVQQQDISRQFKLADLLRQQSMQAPESQMVSGHYVAPSITQYLAKALQGYTANSKENDANNQQNKLYQDYQNKQNTASQALIDGLKGTDTQTGTTNSMPAYTPDQQDRFGSPLPSVQRPVTTTPIMQHNAATPDQIQAAQLKYAQDTGNYAQLGQVANQMAENSINRANKVDDRNYQNEHDQQLYTRNRADNLSDTANSQQFQIGRDTSGYAHQDQSQQAGFIQANKMNASNHAFEAGQTRIKLDAEASLQDAKEKSESPTEKAL